MDSREVTSRFPPGQRDRFPSKAQGESQVPLVPAFPTIVEARADAVLPSSLISLVPVEARDIGPLIPIVPPRETRGHEMREVSLRLQRTFLNRFVMHVGIGSRVRGTHTTGSYREPHGDFMPPFHRYPPRPAGSVSSQMKGPQFDRYSQPGSGYSSG
ncbi:hypothetical protein KY290_033683 [Solanum tuberosum]|uniref:Uncharacterized protein n=1 Tax=Solanum tuberosum TaxID=4113 RepID=A0ABQ7U1I9_SOLTU|nr:hypothetical protein KY290_033683 [Solanum tuberosum]